MENEDGFVSFHKKIGWKPAFKFDDCSNEYLKGHMEKYSKLDAVSKDPDRIERELWSSLGVHTLLNVHESNVKAEDANNPFYEASVAPLVGKREKKRAKKAGVGVEKKWHEISEVCEDDTGDVEVIKKRAVLNASHHMKKTEGKIKKYHRGVIVDDPSAHYDRIPKKQRRKTMLDEILNSADIMRVERKKYEAVVRKHEQKRSIQQKIDKRRKAKLNEGKRVAKTIAYKI